MGSEKQDSSDENPSQIYTRNNLNQNFQVEIVQDKNDY